MAPLADINSLNHDRYSDDEAWSAVLSRHGDDSGLDADLLDGVDSNDFMRADRATGTAGNLDVGGNLAVQGNLECAGCVGAGSFAGDSITAADIVDEPALITGGVGSTELAPGETKAVVVVQFIVPADGWVLVQAIGYAGLQRSTDPTSISLRSDEQEVSDAQLLQAPGPGIYPFTSSWVFSVDAGFRTFTVIATASETGATIDVLSFHGMFFPTLYGCFDGLRLVFDAVDPATVAPSDFVVGGSVPLATQWSPSKPDEITLTVSPYLHPPIPAIEIVGSIFTPGGQTSRLIDVKPVGAC